MKRDWPYCISPDEVYLSDDQCRVYILEDDGMIKEYRAEE